MIVNEHDRGYGQIFWERKNYRNNMSEQAFAEPIFTAVIKRRRNPPKNRRIRKWTYRMRNVSW